MIHRNLRYMTGWEWHVLQLQHKPLTHEPQIKFESNKIKEDKRFSGEKYELMRTHPDVSQWIESSYDRITNNIVMQHVENHGVVVHGTILIQLSEDTKDIAPFHFWLSSNKLITMQTDTRIPLRLQNLDHLPLYEQCHSAPEAFFCMIGILLESLDIGLDQFEERLGQLELDMRERNRKDLLDDIIERRYELLHYSHLYLPIREVEGLAKEAFLDTLTASASYIRIQHRFNRIDSLLKHYAMEIDTLISVDDALSNFRGNEIIRTLTIFTVICLPITLFGAIWGSNFIWLPFKNEPLGFLYTLGAILIITSFIYFLLWKRGWTGDILMHRKKSKQLSKLSINILKPLELEEFSQLPSRKSRNKKEKNLGNLESVVTEYANDKPLPSRKLR
ncbi:MAG: magnesium transporter CorA family protein [Candidatus Pristimantibacillus lignocellulolyticus]|uniref:Magnesium transporter CorA family protein n=1 Tax=Candidatus Pristimantibacillus lignocellulolyticus TaxID=2994561 RepID=A0A9J6ZK49_9BACL|nr:MAG: magnesium transporter CorA family protein [Candidatus Pristimantibacillus lignocellulolyticus]